MLHRGRSPSIFSINSELNVSELMKHHEEKI